MQIIPVMDLKDGVVVHARGGDRDNYRPVQSVLTGSSEPEVIARIFMERFDCRRMYVADLDAISGQGDNFATLRQLNLLGLELMVDCGVKTTAEADILIAMGVGKVIVGTETLEDLEELKRLAALHGVERVIPSLDTFERVVSRCPSLAGLSVAEALEVLIPLEFEEIIALNLLAVGTARGLDNKWFMPLAPYCRRQKIILGGGIRKKDLDVLSGYGFHGALLATAFHTGEMEKQVQMP